MKALIEANAFPNHTEFHSEKLTPLDYACLATDEDSREIVKYLRANGGKYVVEVREFAAGYIQSWWRDILARTKDTREKREAMQSEPIVRAFIHNLNPLVLVFVAVGIQISWFWQNRKNIEYRQASEGGYSKTI